MAKVTRYFKLRIEFTCGAYGNIKEVYKLLCAVSRRALGNVAGDGDCAAPHLADDAILLFLCVRFC